MPPILKGKIELDNTGALAALSGMEKALSAWVGNVNRSLSKVGQSWHRFSTRLSGVISALRTAIMALSAAFVASGAAIVYHAGKFQDLRATLNAITGNAEKTKRIWGEAFELFVKSPLYLGPVLQMRALLESTGITGKKAMYAVAEAAAATGRDIQDVALALVSMEVKPLRKLGVNVSVSDTGEGRTFTYLDRAGNKMQSFAMGIDEARKMLIEILGMRYGGQLEARAHTLNGAWSTFLGILQAILAAMGSQVVETLASRLVKVNNQLLAMLTSPQMEAFAARMGRVVDQVFAVATAFGRLHGVSNMGEAVAAAWNVAVDVSIRAIGVISQAVGYLRDNFKQSASVALAVFLGPTVVAFAGLTASVLKAALSVGVSLVLALGKMGKAAVLAFRGWTSSALLAKAATAGLVVGVATAGYYGGKALGAWLSKYVDLGHWTAIVLERTKQLWEVTVAIGKAGWQMVSGQQTRLLAQLGDINDKYRERIRLLNEMRRTEREAAGETVAGKTPESNILSAFEAELAKLKSELMIDVDPNSIGKAGASLESMFTQSVAKAVDSAALSYSVASSAQSWQAKLTDLLNRVVANTGKTADNTARNVLEGYATGPLFSEIGKRMQAGEPTEDEQNRAAEFWRTAIANGVPAVQSAFDKASSIVRGIGQTGRNTQNRKGAEWLVGQAREVVFPMIQSAAKWLFEPTQKPKKKPKTFYDQLDAMAANAAWQKSMTPIWEAENAASEARTIGIDDPRARMFTVSPSPSAIVNGSGGALRGTEYGKRDEIGEKQLTVQERLAKTLAAIETNTARTVNVSFQ